MYRGHHRSALHDVSDIGSHIEVSLPSWRRGSARSTRGTGSSTRGDGALRRLPGTPPLGHNVLGHNISYPTPRRINVTYRHFRGRNGPRTAPGLCHTTRPKCAKGCAHELRKDDLWERSRAASSALRPAGPPGAGYRGTADDRDIRVNQPRGFPEERVDIGARPAWHSHRAFPPPPPTRAAARARHRTSARPSD